MNGDAASHPRSHSRSHPRSHPRSRSQSPVEELRAQQRRHDEEKAGSVNLKCISKVSELLKPAGQFEPLRDALERRAKECYVKNVAAALMQRRKKEGGLKKTWMKTEPPRRNDYDVDKELGIILRMGKHFSDAEARGVLNTVRVRRDCTRPAHRKPAHAHDCIACMHTYRVRPCVDVAGYGGPEARRRAAQDEDLRGPRVQSGAEEADNGHPAPGRRGGRVNRCCGAGSVGQGLWSRVCGAASVGHEGLWGSSRDSDKPRENRDTWRSAPGRN